MSFGDVGFCFNRRGEPISFMEASALLPDISKRRVAETYLGDDRLRISTIHMPLALPPYGDGPPLIFETMVFVDGEESGTQRYSTEEEALDGHNALVETLRLRDDLLMELINKAARQETDDG